MTFSAMLTGGTGVAVVKVSPVGPAVVVVEYFQDTLVVDDL